MKITFTDHRPDRKTLRDFENIFEKELRLSAKDKLALLSGGVAYWMMVDGEYAGEIYGKEVGLIDEVIPDCTRPNDFYVYSVALFPKFQGKGLSRIFFAYYLGSVNEHNPKQRIIWHATSEGMTKLSDSFGARFGKTHKNWFDSGRDATFRYLPAWRRL